MRGDKQQGRHKCTCTRCGAELDNYSLYSDDENYNRLCEPCKKLGAGQPTPPVKHKRAGKWKGRK